MVPVLTGIAGFALGAVAGFLYRKSIAAGNAHSIEARAQTDAARGRAGGRRRVEARPRRGARGDRRRIRRDGR